MTVYKYFHTKYKTSLTMGFLYINTFNNVRQQYENGAISDHTDGVVNNESGNLFIKDSRDISNKRKIEDLRKSGIDFQGICQNISISNVSFETRAHDAYLYCVTKERNDPYWRHLPETQGGPYKSCMEIYNFPEFIRRISVALHSQGTKTSFIGGECFFEENTGTIAENTTKHPSYFRKPTSEEFRKQQEIRGVFIPSTQQHAILTPKTVYVNMGDLVKFID